MKKITIIGTGYIGLVTGTCLSDFGLSATCVYQDKKKIDILKSDGALIYESNLEALIKKNITIGRLSFTADIESAVTKFKVIFIAVGTPFNHNSSVNKRQRKLMVEKIKHLLGDLKYKTIGVLDLAFKQNTDDVRQSPSLDIIKLLLKEGAKIKCFDPLAMDNAKKILSNLDLNITYCWDEYEYEPSQVKALGFIYEGVGRR